MANALRTLAKKVLWTLKIPYLPEAIRAVVKGPYTVDFPYGETVDTGAYRGATVWDEKVCIGCGACYEVCPAAAIEMVDDVRSTPPMRRFKLYYDRCIFCGHCHYNCITENGIYQSTNWDLATYDRSQSFTTVDKELFLCESCGEVIAPKDHIVWLAKKAGPKAYATPGLALTLEGTFVAAPQPAGRPRTVGDRANIMKVLCPHCRRIVVFEEIT